MSEENSQTLEDKPLDGGGGGDGGGDGGDGRGAAAWYEALPEDIKGNATLTRYTSLEDAARGLIHANGRLRVPAERLLEVPDKPDDAEAMGSFWNKVGRPDKPDGYDLKDSKLEGADSDAFKGFLAAMHKAGPMTPQMARAAEDWYGGWTNQLKEQAEGAIKADREAAEAGLRKEWGGAFDQKADAAAAAALKFGGQDYQAFLDASGMGDHPSVMKAWAGVAEAMAEAGPPQGERGRDGARPMTPAEATAEIARMETDPEIRKALEDTNHPQHGHYIQRRLDLFKAKRGK